VSLFGVRSRFSVFRNFVLRFLFSQGIGAGPEQQ
jgi:hypothetical protein